MVLSVWSVVAVDEVVWTISGSWRRGEERGGERGEQWRERRDREKGGKDEGRKEKREEERCSEERRVEERSSTSHCSLRTSMSEHKHEVICITHSGNVIALPIFASVVCSTVNGEFRCG